MRTRLLILFTLVALLAFSSTGLTEDAPTAASELKTLVSKIQDKLREGKKTEGDLAPELKQFDVLIDKYKDQKTDDTAQIIFMKAMLLDEVLDDTKTATTLIEQIKTSYPETKIAKKADQVLEHMQEQQAAKEVQRSLIIGAKFPDFEEKDLDGKTLSASNCKGKVLLIDFWATWCGPCVMELPNVIKAYEKHHEKGFEVIGISLDQSETKLKSFIKDKHMSWPQYFDGKGWGNKLAKKYGIQSIPSTFLLDGEGKIIGRDLRGEDLEQALAKALPQ